MGIINFEKYRQGDFCKLLIDNTLSLRYSPDQGVFYLTNQDGFIVPKDDIARLFQELNRFFEVHSSEDIEAHNQVIQNRMSHPEMEEIGDGPGHIYLMKDTQNRYKIGLSIDPERRLQQMKRKNGEVYLIHTFPADNMAQAEKALHWNYRLQKIKGEWFDLTDKDIEFIRSLVKYRDGDFFIQEANDGQ